MDAHYTTIGARISPVDPWIRAREHPAAPGSTRSVELTEGNHPAFSVRLPPPMCDPDRARLWQADRVIEVPEP